MPLTSLKAPTLQVAEEAASALREHGYEATTHGVYVDSVAGQYLVAFAIYEAAAISRKGPLPEITDALTRGSDS